jgi:hypothetical protein
MSTGTHARDDGSFGRSAGTQTLKGAALLVVAIVIGVVLLHTAPANTTTISTGPSTPATTKAPRPARTRATTTTAPAPTTSTVPQPHPPAQVHVAVANGSGVSGLAGRIRAQLNSAGYNTTTPALNAPAPVAATTVYYVAGYQPDALAVATGQLSLTAGAVKPMPTPPPVPAAQISGVEVLVIAGSDIGGATSNTTEAPAGNTIAPSPTVASSPTTTAAHHTTTTAPKPTTTAPHTTTTAAHTTTT